MCLELLGFARICFEVFGFVWICSGFLAGEAAGFDPQLCGIIQSSVGSF
jgi:hypothetical protein